MYSTAVYVSTLLLPSYVFDIEQNTAQLMQDTASVLSLSFGRMDMKNADYL